MAQNPLKIASPPPRPAIVETAPQPEPVVPAAAAIESEPKPAPEPRKRAAPAAVKFRQVKEDDRVQFNKRVTRRVADGFEMLAIRSHRKMPELLAEALEMLEERYGRIG